MQSISRSLGNAPLDAPREAVTPVKSPFLQKRDNLMMRVYNTSPLPRRRLVGVHPGFDFDEKAEVTAKAEISSHHSRRQIEVGTVEAKTESRRPLVGPWVPRDPKLKKSEEIRRQKVPRRGSGPEAREERSRRGSRLLRGTGSRAVAGAWGCWGRVRCSGPRVRGRRARDRRSGAGHCQPLVSRVGGRAQESRGPEVGPRGWGGPLVRARAAPRDGGADSVGPAQAGGHG
ncbi:hypothetical protein NDU88_001280 [Pleurodeles waltl]|uniref:Uncharacterized protein n=1 Tax=Pleurodeles waltl TaxID=8319 RepID=A0AAV7UTN7_PLEWA|nr:hypothetical protein NDU88_001280 [Pleurodeles waltl]